jgi:hypothetical protein
MEVLVGVQYEVQGRGTVLHRVLQGQSNSMGAGAVLEMAGKKLGRWWPTRAQAKLIQAWFVQHEQVLEPV